MSICDINYSGKEYGYGELIERIDKFKYYSL